MVEECLCTTEGLYLCQDVFEPAMYAYCPACLPASVSRILNYRTLTTFNGQCAQCGNVCVEGVPCVIHVQPTAYVEQAGLGGWVVGWVHST